MLKYENRLVETLKYLWSMKNIFDLKVILKFFYKFDGN